MNDNRNRGNGRDTRARRAEREARARERLRRETAARRGGSSGSVRSKPKRVPQKPQYAAFFIAATFFGAIACIAIFAMAFGPLIGGGEKGPAFPGPGAPSPGLILESETPAPSGKALSVTGLVTRNNGAAETLDLYEYESGKIVRLSGAAGMEMKDKYGNGMTFEEFAEGEIVDAVYFEGGSIKSLKINPDTWSFKNITGAGVSVSESAINLINRKYDYDMNTVFSYNGRDFDVSGLDPMDHIDIRGYKNFITRLDLIKSHGFLEFAEGGRISGGRVELDGSLIFEIGPARREMLPEGNYRAVIRGANIEPMTLEFTLVKDDTFRLSFSSVKYTTGTISVSASEANARLTVNGAEKPLDRVLEYSFGSYNVRVEKEGFAPWEKTVVLDSEAAEVSLEARLEKAAGNPICRLEITTDPPGAYIFINGYYIGISPVTTSAEYGEIVIRAQMQGYITVDAPMSINEPALRPNIILYPE